MKVQAASNSKHNSIAALTGTTVYNIGKTAATLAKSRALKKSKSANAELKSISTRTLSQDRASANSGMLLTNSANVSHFNCSVKSLKTSSSKTFNNDRTQLTLEIPSLFLTNDFKA